MLALCLLLPVLALAQPVSVSDASDDLLSAFEPNTTAWSAGARDSYSVWGSSCNTTQLVKVSPRLSSSLRMRGTTSGGLATIPCNFQRWFGTTNHPNQIQGLFDRIVAGDKGNISFTCDDLDSECNGQYGVIPGYFSPSTPELTVVCPTFFLSKNPLDQLCTRGQTISSQGSESTDGSWFLHRLLHLPTATGGGLSDVVDTSHEAVELARGVNASQTVKSIHSIQYYALDVYAADLLLPGEGCLGDTSVEVSSSE
ncbi:hypothetical protein EHS25_002774 [Saitozyma podzolica]|uniref:Putative peptidase domain-containing protein n=1 Tax=Saitozyma podzolica TaxID=1890683 RepID=A0A427YDD9_9TREE|nr:hypothetical protein EHS25_002774 [Saitozyma podzolica]